MDFNQLYSDHQRLLVQAERAPTLGFRQSHEVAASHVAGRIGCMQRAVGAGGAGGCEVERPRTEAGMLMMFA